MCEVHVEGELRPMETECRRIEFMKFLAECTGNGKKNISLREYTPFPGPNTEADAIVMSPKVKKHLDIRKQVFCKCGWNS